MFFISQAAGNVPVPELLLALFEGVALVAAVIWVKIILYRRRMKEMSEGDNRSAHVREPDSDMDPPADYRIDTMPDVLSSQSKAEPRTFRSPARRLRKRTAKSGGITTTALGSSRRAPSLHERSPSEVEIPIPQLPRGAGARSASRGRTHTPHTPSPSAPLTLTAKS